MTLLSGLVTVKVDGEVYRASGSFTYNLGAPIRQTQLNENGSVAGYFEEPQENKIEGQIIDGADVDLTALTTFTGATITLELANGKTIVQRAAWYAAEGDAESREGKINFKSVGLDCREV